MRHGIQSHDLRASGRSGQPICRSRVLLREQGDAVLPVGTSSVRSQVRTATGRSFVVLLVLFAGLAFFLRVYGSDLGFLPDDCRPGIGDVERAKSKIEPGMTKDEVRAVLGGPHRQETDQWTYWDSSIVLGSVLRIRFGPDDRVTSSDWWVQ